jgi:DNA-binding NtrC family response regulator
MMTAISADSITIDETLAVIIDDDRKMQSFITAALTPLGMRVESFEAAKEAFAALSLRHPAVIFLDIALLRSDAIDVLRGLGEQRYAGVVQLMSGGRPSLLDAVQRIGVRAGVKLSAPLCKPFARAAVVQVIEELRSSPTIAPDK